MADTRIVKGQFRGIISALVMILIFLIAILIYYNMLGQGSYVEYERVNVTLGEFDRDSGEFSGEYIDEFGDEYAVRVKAYYNTLAYEPSRMKFTTGNTIPVYKSELGYTLYNPNTRKYDDDIYDNK